MQITTENILYLMFALRYPLLILIGVVALFFVAYIVRSGVFSSLTSKATSIFSIFTFPLTIFALLLAVIGLINLFSATQILVAGGRGDPAFSYQASPLFWAQMSYTGLGIVCMMLAASISMRYFTALAYIAYWGAVFLLVLVLIVGAESHGSLSWLDLGIVRLQPSEFGKIGLIFALSRHFANSRDDQPLGIGGLIMPTLIFGVPAALVILQNDLGSSLFYGLIFGSLLMVRGIQIRLIVIALIIVVGVGFVSYKYYLKPYQKNRIVSFMEPEKDLRGSGYHLVQSKIAIGSGGVFGKGYLKGESHKLNFLPECHTDFIFPVLLEEWGFFGGVVVLGLYFMFLISGLTIATRADTRFAFFMATGICALYFWHLVINLGGVLGLMPLTGVTLPLFSYGGSSLIADYVAIGVMLSVLREK